MKNKKICDEICVWLVNRFPNGMSWPHCTKTHKLVWVLGNGPFPDQGPGGGAYRAGSPTQQYNFFCWANPENFSLFYAADQKLFHFYCLTDRHTDRQMHILHPYMHGQVCFLYGNFYLSLHYVPSFASLTHSLRLWRINKSFTNGCGSFGGVIISSNSL